MFVGYSGHRGAAPIQNIGAYGVEVGSFIDAVQVVSTQESEEPDVRWMTADACRFGYRDSIFKQAPGRWLVLAVRFRLPLEADVSLDYPGLRGLALPPTSERKARAQALREGVMGLRRDKGMLPGQWKSAGSFFTNPTLDAEGLARFTRAFSGDTRRRRRLQHFRRHFQRPDLAPGPGSKCRRLG